jgi:hypothetical protein
MVHGKSDYSGVALRVNYKASTAPTEPVIVVDPVPPSVPSGDMATWHSRMLQTITSPNYISVLDPKRMAASGDLYVYARNLNNHVTSMILAYRETGDRDIVRHLDEIMNIAKDQLGDSNSDGFRNWTYNNENGDYTTKPFIGTDLIALDEILAHSMVAAAAYTFKEASFSSSAAFWTDYLRNDFEAKWRARKSKPTGFPFVNHKLMHPTTNFIRYHLYMSKLTGEGSYYSEAVRLTATVKGTMRSSGDGYVWDHEVGKQDRCQPMVYVRYTTQAMVDVATVDSSLFNSSFMQQVANTMASKALTNSTGTPLANDICGSGTYGNTNAFFNFPYAQLAPWDSSGRLRSAAERVYAALERNASSPVNANIPATMVFTLGR